MFSPDGTEMFFAKRINTDPSRSELYFMKLENGIWTAPEKPSFALDNGHNSPRYSEDGNTLFFFSVMQDAGIFYVERRNSGWSNPVKLTIPVPDSLNWGDTFYIDRNGTIYLGLWSGTSRIDIYKSEFVNNQYSSLEMLENPLNTENREVSPFIDSAENFIIFTSNRPGGYGNYDLYISFKNPDGSWGELKNMGDRINSGEDDQHSFISFDGKYLFFIRGNYTDGIYNPYWVDAQIIEELR